ncbi:MAG: DUF4424 domain-containing protein, partial [bacterium]|nr:DUF4424 domain-containing protein [bacterium]
GPSQGQVAQLPKKARDRLRDVGAVNDVYYPIWTVAVTHHWKQSFPTGKIVKIKHEYQAIPGFSYFHGEPREDLSHFTDGCPDDKLSRSLEAARLREPDSKHGVIVHVEWVNYILTTANTWKTPIREFELIVERPPGQFVSLCWDGKVEKISQTRFRATAHDFIPERELMVYFLSVGYGK